ncbi:MAG: SPOR domain-containing protein [Saprospirales bacterium]|nr:SPOR domain-containing protein [Saprospirales bacterium]
MRFKSLTLALFFAAWASLSAFAQTNEQPVYTVYIGTFVETTAADFESIQTLGFPYALSMGNNMFRVYLGGYTKKSEADETAQLLKGRGYQDASVLELDPNKGRTVPIIQLDTELLGKPLNWNAYKTIGPLNVILHDKTIKITSGVYQTMDIANAQLALIRKNGFPDAFVKNVNSAFLHDINAFFPEAINNAPVAALEAPPAPVVPAQTPTSYNKPSQPVEIPQAREVPASYNQPVYRALPAATSSLAPKPSVRPNLKRASVIELQKLLADGGFYKSGVDGLYGKGTAGAYEASLKNNLQVKKYSVLAEQYQVKSAGAQPGSLQFAIDILADNPGAALPILEEKRLPVAKAYMAYYYLAVEGPSLKVNDLMNAAIMEAFAKAVRPPKTRFDYTSAYAYNNLTQLINHLAYVQAMSNPAIQTPCWLVQRHPQDVVNAFTPDPALPAANYSIPDCGGFMEWPEIRTLLSIARDLSGSQQPSAQLLAEGKAQSMRSIIQPEAPVSADQKLADVWHTRMMSGLKGWSSRDLMLTEIAYAYQLLYLQSFVLLEDFYMDKGLKAAEARALALTTLKALVGPYVERFV